MPLTWFRVCLLQTVFSPGHVLKTIRGSFLISQLPELEKQLGQTKSWPSTSKQKLGSEMFTVGFEKLCHIPRILEGHAHEHTVPMLRKDLRRPKSPSSDWPWSSIQAGIEHKGRTVSCLLDNWKHAPTYT